MKRDRTAWLMLILLVLPAGVFVCDDLSAEEVQTRHTDSRLEIQFGRGDDQGHLAEAGDYLTPFRRERRSEVFRQSFEPL